MNLLGLTISRQQKAAPSSLSSVSSRGGWLSIVRECFSGAWQRNIEIDNADVLTYAPVFACVTLIASDIAKMRIKLVQKDRNGIWDEVENIAYSPVLREPNHFQNRIKFLESWVISKLINGNTYVLKERDNRGVVARMYVLDPTLVRPMVASDGSVWYALSADNLSGVEGGIMAPESEIIHDLFPPLYHPLCGVSPLTACGLAAVQGLSVQRSGARFFANGNMPSGILTMPGYIDDPEEKKRIQDNWMTQFTGDNSGKVAVLGGGMSYQAMTMTAVDAQLIDQLRWTAENVCSAYHVPPFMIGVGTAPTYNNIEALNQQYYSQCLQILIESIELLLDKGLGLASDLGTELDLDNLLRMDTATRVASAEKSMAAGMSPNEVRKRYFDLGPVTGGESPMIQQQNYSLAALAKRDAKPDPFAKEPAATPSQPQLPTASDTPDDADKLFGDLLRKELAAA